MRFEDLRYQFFEETETSEFNTTGDVNIEEYFVDRIAGRGDFYELSIKCDVLKRELVIGLINVIHLLIDDMYNDDPIYLTDELADKIIMIKDDFDKIDKLLWEAINHCAYDYLNGTVKDEICRALSKLSIEDMEWEE